MKRKILKQIPDIKREIRDIEKEIVFVKKQMDDLKQEEIYDTVVGSRSDLTIGPIKIRGHPKGYEKKYSELQKKKNTLEQ